MDYPHRMKCHHCDAELVIVLNLSTIDQRLTNIEQAIRKVGVHMSQVDDRLAQLATEVGDIGTAITSAAADVDRALTDLKNALSGALTPEQATAFDTLDASVSALKDSATAIQTAVDTADPTTPPIL